MQPRPEWLETFLAIADTGSLTRAGARVARSQSAVSLQLRQLEDAVGARLFDRDTRHVHLTAAGERLLPLARRALAATAAVAAVAQEDGARTVRVGLPEEYADRLLPDVLAVAGQRDPLVRFEVECAASGELERRVDDGRLDLAVALSDEIRGTGRAICNDPVVWLQAPNQDLSGQRPLPVALFDRACSWRDRALEALDRAGIDFRVVVTSASVAGVRAGIDAGVAVGALARSTAGPGLQPIEGNAAPPPLAAAELVLIGAGMKEEDSDTLAERVRTSLAN